MKNNVIEIFVLWLTGGILYFYLEILFRGYSHYSMIICGGACFVAVGNIGRRIIESDINNILKVLIIMTVGSFVISILELFTGYIVNIKFNMQVWDYTDLPFNYKGQVCVLFSGIWALVSLVCVYINYMIRYFVFQTIKKEEQ